MRTDACPRHMLQQLFSSSQFLMRQSLPESLRVNPQSRPSPRWLKESQPSPRSPESSRQSRHSPGWSRLNPLLPRSHESLKVSFQRGHHVVHVWKEGLSNSPFAPSRGWSWCRGKDTYRLAGQLRTTFRHLPTPLLTSCYLNSRSCSCSNTLWHTDSKVSNHFSHSTLVWLPHSGLKFRWGLFITRGRKSDNGHHSAAAIGCFRATGTEDLGLFGSKRSASVTFVVSGCSISLVSLPLWISIPFLAW